MRFPTRLTAAQGLLERYFAEDSETAARVLEVTP